MIKAKLCGLTRLRVADECLETRFATFETASRKGAVGKGTREKAWGPARAPVSAAAVSH
jgi:hypothetical protein